MSSRYVLLTETWNTEPTCEDNTGEVLCPCKVRYTHRVLHRQVRRTNNLLVDTPCYLEMGSNIACMHCWEWREYVWSGQKGQNPCGPLQRHRKMKEFSASQDVTQHKALCNCLAFNGLWCDTCETLWFTVINIKNSRIISRTKLKITVIFFCVERTLAMLNRSLLVVNGTISERATGKISFLWIHLSTSWRHI